MSLQVSLAFKGNGREALEFYQKVFNFETPQIMTYGSMPPDPSYTLPDELKDYIMYTSFDVLGVTVMLSDFTPDMEYTVGINVGLAIVLEDSVELTRLYDALCVGGRVEMPLEKTFWADLYGIVTDKYGVQWQFNLERPCGA